jgi:hypothetical protein
VLREKRRGPEAIVFIDGPQHVSPGHAIPCHHLVALLPGVNDLDDNDAAAAEAGAERRPEALVSLTALVNASNRMDARGFDPVSGARERARRSG